MEDYRQDKKYFECNCIGNCNILQFSWYDHCQDEECGPALLVGDDRFEFDLSMFQAKGMKFGFWWRIRLMWKLLTTGEVYGDQICFDLKQIKEIRKYLDKVIKNCDKRKRDSAKKIEEGTGQEEASEEVQS